MGLHRDGKNYTLSPIEVHVRRLIWLQICFLDIRTCEAQGPQPSIRRDDYDTELPLNVNDVDLQSQSMEPPVPSNGWTEMTFSRIRFECNDLHRAMWIDRQRLEKKKTSLTTVLGKIENFRRRMNQTYGPICDERVPVQKAAKLIMSLMINKAFIMVLHVYHGSLSSVIPDRLRQM
jgi:hypothetical protein